MASEAPDGQATPGTRHSVANLQNCAWVLLDTPETLPVALELLNQWVVPNATLMRAVPRTSACSWENTIQGAYASYQKADDPQGERRVLELLSTQARDPGLRDLATLRLAGLRADQGNLKEAIDIARKSDSRGEFFEPRARLLEIWQQELKTKKTRYESDAHSSLLASRRCQFAQIAILLDRICQPWSLMLATWQTVQFAGKTRSSTPSSEWWASFSKF